MADVKYVLKNEGACVKKIEDSETEYKYNFYTGATNIGFRTWEVGIILAHCYNKIQIWDLIRDLRNKKLIRDRLKSFPMITI